MEVQLKELVC